MNTLVVGLYFVGLDDNAIRTCDLDTCKGVMVNVVKLDDVITHRVQDPDTRHG